MCMFHLHVWSMHVVHVTKHPNHHSLVFLLDKVPSWPQFNPQWPENDLHWMYWSCVNVLLQQSYLALYLFMEVTCSNRQTYQASRFNEATEWSSGILSCWPMWYEWLGLSQLQIIWYLSLRSVVWSRVLPLTSKKEVLEILQVRNLLHCILPWSFMIPTKYIKV